MYGKLVAVLALLAVSSVDLSEAAKCSDHILNLKADVMGIMDDDMGSSSYGENLLLTPPCRFYNLDSR